jgi:hypothetical protein
MPEEIWRTDGSALAARIVPAGLSCEIMPVCVSKRSPGR